MSEDTELLRIIIICTCDHKKMSQKRHILKAYRNLLKAERSVFKGKFLIIPILGDNELLQGNYHLLTKSGTHQNPL